MTIKEIAQLAGVSVSTVSKVMNNKDSSISAETRERVLQTAKQFNYVPYAGSATGDTKSFLLGVIFSSSNALKMIDGILDAAQAQGYQVITFKTYGDQVEEENAIAAFCKNNIDAVLWQPTESVSPKLKKKLRCHNIPYLFLPSASNFFKTDDVDFSRIGYTAAESFIRTGHKNIAFLSASSFYSDSFFKGYKEALFNANLSFQESFLFHQIDELLLTRIASGFISAIFVPDCLDAVKLYDILTRRHYRIPRDLSMITTKDDRTETALIPQISSIDIPYYSFGQHLVRNLIALLEQNVEPDDFKLRCQLKNKVSVCPPRPLQKKHMTVIGSINIDNYLTVNQLPISGMTSTASTLALYPGGKAVNMAIGVSRLGAEASVLGAIGTDLDSDLIFTSLEEHDITTDKLLRFSDTPTGRAFIFVQPDGDSTISILTGANDLLEAHHVTENKKIFDNCCCCLLQTEVPSPPLIAAAKIAHEREIPVILKPSSCIFLEPELLKYTDIIVPNQNEMKTLAPGNDFEERTQYFLDAGVSIVIVTMGEHGCTLKTRETEKHFDIPCSFISVDNTGAGDAFISALAVYLQKGYELDSAIQIAMYAAGFCISREGVALSMIDKNALESFIRKKEPDLLHN